MNDRISRVPYFIPPDVGGDALELVAVFCVGAFALLVVAGLVECAIALHRWLMSYVSDIESGS